LSFIVFDEIDLLFALSFFFREGKLTMIISAIFFQCIRNVSISPSRRTHRKKNQVTSKKKKKKPCERKKNRNEFRLNDFRNKKFNLEFATSEDENK
jgi:phage terminase large subunit-like protein